MKFHIGVILSMLTGKLLCEIGDIYKIAEHLSGEPIWTHQLGRVMNESRPHLLRAFPKLAIVAGAYDVRPEDIPTWLAKRASELGEWFDVEPMPKESHASIDPLTEMSQMVAPERIVTITT